MNKVKKKKISGFPVGAESFQKIQSTTASSSLGCWALVGANQSDLDTVGGPLFFLPYGRFITFIAANQQQMTSPSCLQKKKYRRKKNVERMNNNNNSSSNFGWPLFFCSRPPLPARIRLLLLLYSL